MKFKAFTMAEILITLGLIGIVAAMTFPIMIKNYTYKVTETRLKKFYTSINQAVMLAEVKYGDKSSWFEDLAGASIDSDGKPIEGSSQAEKWFRKYLGSQLNVASYDLDSYGRFIVYFADGSALKQSSSSSTRDWYFFPSNADKCFAKYGNTPSKGLGICAFAFNFKPNSDIVDWTYHRNKGFEPWKYRWDGSLDSLWEGCRGANTNVNAPPSVFFCTALIQYYGWNIPKNYPKRISY